MDRPRRVLIVEDEAMTAMVIDICLRKLGHDVLGYCATGEDAVKRANDESPDLIFMDVRLAGKLDGVEAAEIIASQGQVPIVFMSGYSTKEDLRRISGRLPVGFLEKPFALADVERILSSISGG